MLVERYGLGELADGAADHGRKAEARREQGADDEEQGKYGGHAPALHPEHGRCGDGRDEHREQERHEHCLGCAQTGDDDHDAREHEHVARPRGEAFEGFHDFVLRARRLGVGTFSCDVSGAEACCLDRDAGAAHGQREAPATRAAGVQEREVRARFQDRFVGMTDHDQRSSGGGRRCRSFASWHSHMTTCSKLHEAGFRQCRGEGFEVVVAAHGRDRARCRRGRRALAHRTRRPRGRWRARPPARRAVPGARDRAYRP